MKKSVLALTIAATTMGLFTGSADACSRISIDTGEHGVLQVRTLDWDSPLGTVAVVHPAGEKDRVNVTDGRYKNNAQWTTKYTTVAFEEHTFFHKAIPSGRNVHGLMVDTLYQSSSAPFVEKNVEMDEGKVTVGPGQIATYLPENYKTTDEVRQAFKKGEFDIAWGQQLVAVAHQHGFHTSVIDASGDALLFQLGEDGKTVMYSGDLAKPEFAVMANEPLLSESLEYASQFGAVTDLDFMNKVPAGIRSLDRFTRLMGMTALHTPESYKGKSFMQAVGSLNGAFDHAANLAQFVPAGKAPKVMQEQDELLAKHHVGWNEAGVYPSRIKYTHALENGFVEMVDLDTYRQISFNMNDVKGFTKPMCADMAAQANDGKHVLEFKECGAEIVELGK
ncbi:linear amide C-N hydrolase [Paraferrimonas sedimenticola]|uniref:Choloylglycine hydrolase/NAAA C-terminal domain-containing protein n=1 Tax=Paraferrimonas sedimenticola TaxID=375674 RepID=A0AA37RTF8_9GAMM|nr:linear amide C-N hydrolase [Paraferrimonas sedimenticola]GLP95148.1 hypothetical protein GCM10007895_04540 [Paraferrimonas sedimenticola]